MNEEVIKAMQGRNHTSKIKKWWRKNAYKILRVVLFPIWIWVWLKEKYNTWQDNKQHWDAERAKNILNYYIPRRAHWDAKAKAFDFFDNGMGWTQCLAKRNLKRKDYRFWKVNNWTIRQYLIEQFELDGFTKVVGNCSDGWTTISFVLKEEGD